MLSSCVHKELSPGSRKFHENIVTDMKEKILEYCYPFLNGPARHLKTCVEIDVNIVQIYYHQQRLRMKCLESL